eukprot:m.1305829 g.1305829  ORF g.1305829 m.1305829 type:complete len:638 (+) comp24814_c0_seq1:280-2193(+)
MWVQNIPSTIVLTYLTISVIFAEPTTRTVRIDGGLVRGSCTNAICSFKNIPYAIPPTPRYHGRFRPPRALNTTWKHIRDGTKDGYACFQTPQDPTTSQSEDCLHLTVWTDVGGSRGRERAKLGGVALKEKHIASTRKPVFVFFYGGGALQGATAWYNFSALARDGAVVIAPNYRLGPLGFLATAELSATAEGGIASSGNYGLMDCELAVNWAKENAEVFGGDPNSITIMGQSSGATMVWGLMNHPRSELLFHHAIALSGSPKISTPLQGAEKQNAPLAAAVGCSPTTDFVNVSRQRASWLQTQNVANCLRYNATPEALSFGHIPINTTWQEFDTLTWGIASPHYHDNNGGQWPLPGIVIVDGAFITQQLEEALRSGINKDVGLLVSNVGEECDLSPNFDWSSNTSAEPMLAWVTTQLAPWANDIESFGAKLLQKHFAPALAANRPQQAYLQLASQMGTSCGQMYMVEQARLGRSAADNVTRPLHYTVLGAGPSHPQVLGVANLPDYVSRYAYHQVDLLWAMEFWNWFPQFTGEPTNYTPSAGDLTQAALLRKIWLDFARGQSEPGGVPPFYQASNEEQSKHMRPKCAGDTKLRRGVNGDYTVGVIGKQTVAAVKNWQMGLCDELEEHKLWKGFWWMN